jgi:hypothetical protein
MSSELSVKIRKDLDVKTLLGSGENVLRELLLLPHRPLLTAERLRNGARSSASGNETLRRTNGALIIRLQNEKEEVALVLYEIEPHPKVEKQMSGLWADLVVGAMRTPLEYVLAAALAIALAEEMGSKIFDDGLVWSSVLEQEPQTLLQTIQVRRQIPDIHLAADHIYSAMPVKGR